MTTVGGPVDRAFKDAAVAYLLDLQTKEGFVSNAVVRSVAGQLCCSGRTVRRLIKSGGVSRKRAAWVPDQLYMDFLHMTNGNAVRAMKALEQNGAVVPVGKRTVQRALAERYDQALVKGIRAGSMAEFVPTLDKFVPYRNHTWAIDHTLLPIWVRLGKELCQPWLTTVEDECHRVILAMMLYGHSPNTEMAVETIAIATEGFIAGDGTFVGGKPERILSDRGSDLVTTALTMGLIEQGIDRTFSEAYTPQQNGRIERWHGTLKREVFVGLPGYWKYERLTPEQKRAATKAAKKGIAPISAEGLLTLDELQVILQAEITMYNEDRPHSSLGGKTPVASWAADTQPLHTVNPAAIRAAMTNRKTATVRKARIRFDKRFYITDPTQDGQADWLSRHEGRSVEVRSLPTRIEKVSIFLDGTYQCDAIWSDMRTEEHVAAAVARRMALTREIRLGQANAAQLRVQNSNRILAEHRKAAAEALEGLPDLETRPETPQADQTGNPMRAPRQGPAARAKKAHAVTQKHKAKAARAKTLNESVALDPDSPSRWSA